MNLNIKPIIKTIERSIKGHSSDILTGVGISGMISATIFAVKATPRALMKIEKERQARGIQPWEKTPALLAISESWKDYIPATVITIASAACLIAARKIDIRGKAALATVCSLSESALKDYKESVKEITGEDTAEQIEKTAATKAVKETPVSDDTVIYSGHGSTLFYDTVLGRYFYSSKEAIIQAINEVNRIMTYELAVTLNDLYSEMDLPSSQIGDDIGWNINDGLINARIYSLSPDDRPPYAIAFTQPPKYEYQYG